MKTIYIITALLFANIASAGELRHIRAEHKVSGDAMQYIQRSLEQQLQSLLIDRNAVVEPTIVNMKFVNGGKRFLFGPFAGGSYVTLRVKITHGDQVAEETFYENANAFKGTVTVGGTDNHMLKAVSNKAAEFVRTTLSADAQTSSLDR